MKLITIQLWPDRSDVTLTALLHENSKEFSDGRLRPAVLVCPGGGYCYCSAREAEPVAARFFALGYHAFVLRYSTAGTDEKNPNPAARWPLPLYDLAKAMLTIREHAEFWYLKSEQIAVCGFSAGGHLAASLATRWNALFLAEHMHCDAEALRPAAAILGYALTDCVSTDAYHAEKGSLMFTSGCNTAMFGTPEPTDMQRAEASPVSYVSADTVPTFLVHAADDFLVPAENSLNYAAAALKSGVDCELHMFPRGSHGFALADETTSTYSGEMNIDCAHWPELVARWLSKYMPLTVSTASDFAPPSRGKLPSPPQSV